jgi:hypothetical protein
MGVAAAGGGAASGPVMTGDGCGTLAAIVVLPLAWPGPPPGLAVSREHRAAFQRDIAPQTDEEPAQGTIIRVAEIAGSRRPAGRRRSGCGLG